LILMTKKRTVIILIAAVLVAVILVGSFAYLSFQKPYAGNVETITLAIYPTETNALPYVASSQQYFQDNGLNVNIKTYSGSAAAVSAMINGQADIATSSEFVFTENILKNENISTFGSSVLNVQVYYVVARTDKGINSISDLKGKTIGVPLGTAAQFDLGQFLQLNGISLNQVTIQNVPPSSAPSFLANGTVDADVSSQPYIGQIQSLLGNQTVMWPAQVNQPSYILMMGTTSWVSTHQDLVTRFLRAMVQAANFNGDNQKQAIADVAKGLNNTVAYETTVWPQYQFSFSLDNSLVLLMQEEARWLISNNLTTATTVPNFLNYIYINSLKSVSPQSVDIIGLGD